ncbi:MAG: MBL fold metallo-hydrolase [Rubrivivax sp.]
MSLAAAFAVTFTAAFIAGCAGGPSATPAASAPDAATLIARAEQALGAANATTLSVTARGSGSTFGQAYVPNNVWPALTYSVLSRSFNFETGAMREEYGRARAEPNGGGAVPLMGQGEQRVVGFVRENFAWNQAGTAVAAAPLAVAGRQHDLWLATPHGALKAAKRFNATSGTRTVDGKTYNTLAFAVPGAFAATLLLDADNTVARIDSTQPNPVLGDTATVTTFTDYRDIGGTLRFPMRLRQQMGGHEVLDLAAAQVTLGTPVDIAVPDNVRGFRENVAVMPVAEGVWFLGGGSHNSVAIEMDKEIVLVEAPLYDGRTLAVFAAANALVLGKKVGTVINSHHHFDHAGGLRTAAGEGATIVVNAAAKPYFERAFANPNKVAPDHLAASGKSPRLTASAASTSSPTASARSRCTSCKAARARQRLPHGLAAQGAPADRGRRLHAGAAEQPAAAGAQRQQRELVQNIERSWVQRRPSCRCTAAWCR